MIFQPGLRADSSVRRVVSCRVLLLHWLGFLRDAPVFQMGLRRGVLGYWLGLRGGASVFSLIRSRQISASRTSREWQRRADRPLKSELPHVVPPL
jgi:hypothetical protein